MFFFLNIAVLPVKCNISVQSLIFELNAMELFHMEDSRDFCITFIKCEDGLYLQRVFYFLLSRPVILDFQALA